MAQSSKVKYNFVSQKCSKKMGKKLGQLCSQKMIVCINRISTVNYSLILLKPTSNYYKAKQGINYCFARTKCPLLQRLVSICQTRAKRNSQTWPSSNGIHSFNMQEVVESDANLSAPTRKKNHIKAVMLLLNSTRNNLRAYPQTITGIRSRPHSAIIGSKHSCHKTAQTIRENKIRDTKLN